MLQVILDASTIALRMLLPIYAIVIVYSCYASMRRRRRPEKPLVMLYNEKTQERTPILYWENSIGRGKGNDVNIEDPTVSRDHCVLLRRKEGWFIKDTGSKSGTFVNGKIAQGRTKVFIDDEISVGSSSYVFRRGEEYDDDVESSSYFLKVKNKPAMKAYKLMILITFFHLFMAVEATFSFETQDIRPLIYFGLLATLYWVFFFVSTILLKRVNFELEALAIFLSGIGVLLLVRQDQQEPFVQLAAIGIGMIIFAIIVKFIENPDRIAKFRIIIMLGAVGILALNLILGTVRHGAANWIIIGPVSIQPSELVKIAFIFVGAATLDELQTKGNLIIFIIFSAVCVGALALMGDFGTALIFFATFLLIAFMRSGDFRTIILALVGAVFGGTVVLRFKPYIADRFASWGKVWEHSQAGGYQQARVLTYIASGGLFGVGIGNGYLKYVFASESDLVFGLVAEEMGFIVAATIAISICSLVFYSRAITTRSRSTFYSISACSAAGLFVIQMSLNIFGATDILPLTGVTLPFVSLGGSSMMSCWGLLAFIKAADERTYALKR